MRRQIPRRRRGIVALSLFSTGVMGIIALYQVGLLKRLPPTGRLFNAEAVHGSDEAYALFGIPDALLGMTSYAATACLAGARVGQGSGTAPFITLAMGAKLTLDLTLVSSLSVMQWVKFRRLSPWSLAVCAATWAMAGLAAPDVVLSPKPLTKGINRDVRRQRPLMDASAQ